MKIFNRGNEKPAAAGPAAVVAAAPPPEAPQPEAAPAGPDITQILDANVKEMSEKLARLTSSLENAQADRQSFESKLELMEERMRKLSSLTEMISAQYNPFVGDAPTEREPMPAPDVGLAAPMPTMPPIALPEEAPALELPAAGFDDAAAPALSFDLAPAPEAPAVEMAPEALDDAWLTPPADEEIHEAPAFPEDANGTHIWSIPSNFETSMLLLGWADMLLKSAGSRENVVSLISYYHNIGWIGDPARDQLLAYVDGLREPRSRDASEPPAEIHDGEWRLAMDIHERSLLFVEKLKAASARRRK